MFPYSGSVTVLVTVPVPDTDSDVAEFSVSVVEYVSLPVSVHFPFSIPDTVPLIVTVPVLFL